MPLDVRAPFVSWLEQFDPVLPVSYLSGQDRVAILADDRDDETTRRVYANAAAVLGDGWSRHYLPIRGGNDLLYKREFWASIPEQHVLIFQRDSILFRPASEAELAYDMIGSPCGAVMTEHWTMNGGLSVRRRDAMLRALRLELQTSEPEDRFFTRVLRDWDMNIPDIETAARFAVESGEMYRGAPIGVHGTDKWYMTDDIAEQIVREAFAMQAMQKVAV